MAPQRVQRSRQKLLGEGRVETGHDDGEPMVPRYELALMREQASEALRASVEEARELSDTRVTDCVKRFRGAIDIWDVVNEATDPWRFRDGNRMTRAWEELGVLDWTVRSFQLARRANPAARLHDKTHAARRFVRHL